MRPNPKGHPARFSDEVVDLFAEILAHEHPVWFGRPMLFDPFAGTGEALEDLAKRLDYSYAGLEIEPEFINAINIIEGDATDGDRYPAPPYVIITSPAYPNGMSDSWKMSDGSKRYTYQRAKNDLVGKHAELHPNNQGQYGYRGTRRGGRSTRRVQYWRIAEQAVMNWVYADMVLLNVSDFKHSNGQIEPLVTDWRWLLRENGWTNMIEHPVATPRMRNGENAKQRVEHEVIVVAKR